MLNPVYIYIYIYIYGGGEEEGVSDRFGEGDLLANNLLVLLFLNELEFICLHTVKWLQVLLSNINNSIQYSSFVC